MSAEHEFRFSEVLPAQASFVRELLSDPTGQQFRENYNSLYMQVARAAGCGTRGQFNSEYVERRYADMAYEGLSPHDHDPMLREVVILTPVFAGYVFQTLGAFTPLVPQIMAATFSRAQISIPSGREEDAYRFTLSQMQYGAELYGKANPLLPHDPKLDPFRDFVKTLDLEDL